MFGNEFYHETIRRYVIVFGTMFNDMIVWRRDSAGAISKRLKVPIAYGPRSKFISKIQQDPLLRVEAVSLPRMGFQITGYNYDSNRKLQTIGYIRNVSANTDIKNSMVYNPVPYNIDFELSIYVLNAEDGTMLIEQILPYFTPEWTNTIKLVDDIDLRMDVPVVLNSLTTEDTYEDSYDNRRTIIHTLSFTMKGYLFGPVKEKSVINLANTRVYVDGFNAITEDHTSGTDILQSITITTGGTGYNNTQVATFSNATSNATASITTNSTGGITSLTILTQGDFTDIANNSIIRTQIANTTAASNGTNGNTSAGTGAAFTFTLAASDHYLYITTTPGLTANGLPTANASLSVAANTISSTDDYGYIITKTYNPTFDDPAT